MTTIRSMSEQQLLTRKLQALAETFKSAETPARRMAAASQIITLLPAVLAGANSPPTSRPAQQDESYDTGFQDGLQAAVDLTRSGATPDDLAQLLTGDPGRSDPRAYQDRLGELRRILGTGFESIGQDQTQEIPAGREK